MVLGNLEKVITHNKYSRKAKTAMEDMETRNFKNSQKLPSYWVYYLSPENPPVNHVLRESLEYTSITKAIVIHW